MVSTLGVFILDRTKDIGHSSDIVLEKRDESAVNAMLTVDVQGAVQNPGVFELEYGSTVDDALSKAGGLSSGADLELLAKSMNRAEQLVDGQKLLVPSISDKQESVLGVGGETEGKTNINTASLSELDALPRIGPAYAQRIIDGRPYSSIEDIKDIKGIGDSIFEEIKDLISV